MSTSKKELLHLPKSHFSNIFPRFFIPDNYILLLLTVKPATFTEMPENAMYVLMDVMNGVQTNEADAVAF